MEPSSTPRRIILSLHRQPYKSIMQSHFRLLGPATKAVGMRSEYMRLLEKEVARRIFYMLCDDSLGVNVVSNNVAGSDVALGNISKRAVDNDGATERQKNKIQFIKLIQFGKGAEEEVDRKWALKKISQDIYRRMESYKTWSTYHKVAGNENDLLLITSDEFEALKKKVEATLKHDVNFELKFNSQSSVSETKNEGTTPNANIATALSSSDVNVSPNETTKLNSVKNSKRIAFISRNEVCPLKAIIYRSSKMIDVTVSLSKEAYNTSIATNQLVTTQKKSTPTVPHTKQFHKTPNHHSKMFVTPTSSYNYNTPVSSIRRAIQTTRDIKNPADKLEYDFSKYERQASEFHKNVGMLFPEIVHAMVTNASTTIPCVLHWDGDGDRFVVEKVDAMGFVLEQYFKTNQYTSFVRQLNLYGWCKLADGSFHHPLFHRDMDLSESTLKHFVRGGTSSFISPMTCRSTPKRTDEKMQSSHENYPSNCASDRSFVKRNAFHNAVSGIKSALKTNTMKLEGNCDSDEEFKMFHKKQPKKRGPGRPRNPRKLDSFAEIKTMKHADKVKVDCIDVNPTRGKPADVLQEQKKRGPGRPRKIRRFNQHFTSTLPGDTNSHVEKDEMFSISSAYMPNDIIYANVDSEYDALWLSNADEIFSYNDIAVAPNPADEVDIPTSTKRFSFMPTNNVKLQMNSFSPIRLQQFAQEIHDKVSPKEVTSMVEQHQNHVNLVGYTTPSKGEDESSAIEFSWRSSASCSFERAVTDLPSLDIDGFVSQI